MAKVMIRENEGRVLFYVAKKDLEEPIESIEFDTEEKWGGEVRLKNGMVWFVEPGPRKIPGEFNARKLQGDD